MRILNDRRARPRGYKPPAPPTLDRPWYSLAVGLFVVAGLLVGLPPWFPAVHPVVWWYFVVVNTVIWVAFPIGVIIRQRRR
jgi:hypothetical protein